MVTKNEHFELGKYDEEYYSLLKLENKLQDDLDTILQELVNIDLDREKLQNNEYLEESLQDLIWGQVQNQLAVQIGEEFIDDNRGQNLNLRKSAHIQTVENFEKGKFASHNGEVDYEQRYEEWKNNFTTNKKGEKVLAKNAREFFDKGRDKGSASVHKDHTVSIKEQLNDVELATFSSKEEIKEFANSSKNLHDLDASANMSKGDKTMNEFLNSERNGLTVEERFNIDRKQLEEDDKEAREALAEHKKNAKEKAIQSGKKSRRKEALKITGKALKVVIYQLLSEFLREVVKKFIAWLGEKEKNFNSFIGRIKEAIETFVENLSQHLLNVGQSVVSMLATSIIGPVVGTLLQVWTFLQQGWKSFMQSIQYLSNPENQRKDTKTIILELGKIVIGGVTAMGAISLGTSISATLASIPPLNVEIPLLGSIASLIGTFMGATVAGIAGAFVLKMIDQKIVNHQLDSLNTRKIDGNNDKLNIQEKQALVSMAIVQEEKVSSINSIEERHRLAADFMETSFKEILHDVDEHRDEEFSDIDALLAELLE